MPEFRTPRAGESGLFAARPHDQFGATDAGAWYGLLWHRGRPGGTILCQADDGREIAVLGSDTALQSAWQQMTGDIPDPPSGHRDPDLSGLSDLTRTAPDPARLSSC